MNKPETKVIRWSRFRLNFTWTQNILYMFVAKFETIIITTLYYKERESEINTHKKKFAEESQEDVLAYNSKSISGGI